MSLKTTTPVVLFLAMSVCACTRSTQTTDTVPVQKTSNGTQPEGTNGNNSSSQNTNTNNELETSNANSTNENVVGASVAPGCFDSSAKPITGQFQDKNKNTNQTNAIDCYNSDGLLVYRGTAKNCLEEMQIRFGPDIIFPSQQLFPKQYEAARAQGAGGQAALKQTLSSSSCSALKAKE